MYVIIYTLIRSKSNVTFSAYFYVLGLTLRNQLSIKIDKASITGNSTCMVKQLAVFFSLCAATMIRLINLGKLKGGSDHGS